ncbi:macro domain-containing protein [Microbacterium aureliae]
MIRVTAVQGDIMREHVDAIVNAANNRMRGGGGVDGAIHRAAGPALLADCIRRFPDGLASGDAGWTIAGNLPAAHVIHTVGPNRNAGETDPALLESCFRRVLEVADELGARCVAAPLVGAGVYGWPRAASVTAALDAAQHTPTGVEELRLVAFDDAAYRHVRALVHARFPPPVAPGSIGSLFERGVTQWGLRGDPYLWRELRARLGETPLPEDWFGLRSVVLAEAADVLGTPLDRAHEPLHMAEFDPGHGMSAGTVDPAWWMKTGIPILLDRFAAVRDGRGAGG